MTVASSEEGVPAARRNTALYFTVSSAVAALGFAATLWATLMDGKPFDSQLYFLRWARQYAPADSPVWPWASFAGWMIAIPPHWAARCEH